MTTASHPPLTLVLTALPIEFEAVRGRLPEGSLTKILDLPGNVDAWHAPARGLLLARSGVGPIAAGLTCGVLLSRFTFARIVLVGVAGALHASLKPGDLVVSTGVVQHDALFLGDQGRGLMRPGALHVSIPAHQRADPFMKADTDLLSDVAATIRGVILSGASFAGTKASKVELLERRADGVAVDMEAAAVAFAAHAAGVPFSVAKTISDRLEPQGDVEDEFRAWLPAAAEHAATVVDSLLHHPPVDTN